MRKIVIIGLGPGDPAQVTAEAHRYLTGNNPLYFRTLYHPAARFYSAKRKKTFSFDNLYEDCENFEEVYRSITKQILYAVQRSQIVCYAVPGNPSVGESTVDRLRRMASRLGIKIKVVAGLSFLEPMMNRLKIDLLDGLTVLDALELEKLKEPLSHHLILAQVYSRAIASRVKLGLLELYHPEHPVTIVKAAGEKNENIKTTDLSSLDHSFSFNHSVSLYLPPCAGRSLGELTAIMEKLRAEDGCPWDRKQNHLSLRQYLIEEAYEVVSAIDDHNDQELLEELGDLLLQVIFHSQIAREEGRFTMADVIEAITGKLKRRHPHVFGSRKAADAEAVKTLWEEIKAGERKLAQSRNVLAVDQGLPALLKAFKLQKKAAALGFDWPTAEGPLEKAGEELAELSAALKSGEQEAIEEELGDFLFSIVNLSRFLKVNPELALGKTILKFNERFSYIIEKVEYTGKSFDQFSLEELDQWWNEAKKIGKKGK